MGGRYKGGDFSDLEDVVALTRRPSWRLAKRRR
jgi:hypothetical protein